MLVDWQPEIQVFDLAGLEAAVEAVKAPKKQKDDEEIDESKDLNGLSGRLINGGNYDRCAINKSALPEEKIQKMREKVELVCFQRKMTSNEVIRAVNDLKRQLASPAHILAIGMLYPQEQMTAPIVQLDPTGAFPPIVLSSSCYGRNAVFGHFDGPSWPSHSRFIVFDNETEFLSTNRNHPVDNELALQPALEWV